MAAMLNGSQLVTADAVLGISAQAKIVFCIHVISTSGGGAVINLRRGGAVGDTIGITETGTVSKGVTFNYEGGMFFPGGCFVDVDANTTSVLVSYREA